MVLFVTNNAYKNVCFIHKRDIFEVLKRIYNEEENTGFFDNNCLFFVFHLIDINSIYPLVPIGSN